MKHKAIYSAIPAVLGVILLLSYLNNAAGVLDLPDKLVLFLFFAIGPAAIIGILKISKELKAYAEGLTLTAGTVFLVIGFAFFNLMLVVQQTIFAMMRQYLGDTKGIVAAEAANLISKSVNLVQIGMDISFDIFYCLGLMLFASAMCRHPHYGRILGISGIVIGCALLALNMHTFPIPPAESGLIDLGPLSGVWWLVVITIGFIRQKLDKSRTAVA